MAHDRYKPEAVPGDVTPQDVFVARRAFLKTALGAGLLVGPLACGQEMSPPVGEGPNPRVLPPRAWPEGFSAIRNDAIPLPAEIGRTLTPRLIAGSHNNFYEFLPGKGGDVWPRTAAFTVDPWTVEVTGACRNPQTLDLDDLAKIPHEERVCHFRCVERWAMNVPWIGFPLRTLLEQVQPTSHARFVRFVSANRPGQMPGLRSDPHYPWPYHEGLRMDEAMNDLALVATGVYGDPLTKQHGAPVRMVVPWKYGYKNPKSIVRIELLRDQPKTFWQVQPHEYGFISNVNPNIPHPRWSQTESYWLGPSRDRFPTPIFNGYGKYVAHLYPDEPTTLQAPLRAGQVAR